MLRTILKQLLNYVTYITTNSILMLCPSVNYNRPHTLTLLHHRPCPDSLVTLPPAYTQVYMQTPWCHRDVATQAQHHVTSPLNHNIISPVHSSTTSYHQSTQSQHHITSPLNHNIMSPVHSSTTSCHQSTQAQHHDTSPLKHCPPVCAKIIALEGSVRIFDTIKHSFNHYSITSSVILVYKFIQFVPVYCNIINIILPPSTIDLDGN